MSKDVQGTPGWRQVRLGDIADVVGGGTPKSDVSELWNGDIAWATPTDVTELSGFNIRTTKRTISQLGLQSSNATLLPPNSVLVTSRATVGYVAINTIPMATNQGFVNLIPKLNENRADTLFLAYLLENHRGELRRLAAGSTFLEVSRSSVQKMHVQYPPLSERYRIAQLLSSIDEALEASKAVLEQLKASRKGLIQKSFGDGIRYKFEGYTKTPKVPFPENWELCKLKALCTRITDGVHQPVLTDSRGTVPFLYVSSVRPGAINWERAGKITQKTYDEISKGRPPSKNVILYTAVGSYGNAVLLQGDAPVAFQRHIAYVAVDIKKAVPRFLEHWLNSSFSRDFADRIAVGNAQKTVTLNELSNFPVFLPPVKQQLEIVETLSSLNRRVKAEVKRAQQLEIIKKGLMQQLLTGKLRVAVDDG